MSIIIPANSAVGGGFNVDNSLRFNSGSSEYLNKTFGTPTSNQKCTYSGWTKRSKITDAGGQYLLTYYGNYSNAMYFNGAGTGVGSNDQFVLYCDPTIRFYTNRLFRDPSAWYHVVVAIDTTQGTASNRVKIYINGVRETSFLTETYPSQNGTLAGLFGGTGAAHNIGRGQATGANSYFGGYMSEIAFIDGLQLDPTSFGEFDEDSGVWKPIDVSGLTFGNNGFYQQYKQSGTGTNASGLGADTSGNDNHFAVNNLTAVDQSTDTCTNNFATINPLNVPSSNLPTFSEGNLVSITNTSTGSYKWGGCTTIGMTSGKFYCEAKATIDSTYSRNVIGITGDSANLARTNGTILNTTASCGYYSSNGSVAYNGAGDVSGYNTSYATGDIIGIAFDLDNGKLYFSKNGTFLNSGNPTSGSTGTGAVSINAASTTPDGAYFFAQSDDTGTSSPSKFEFNFGSPSYAISSGNADGNGYGNFEYAVPSGYFSLNTKNLAEYG